MTAAVTPLEATACFTTNDEVGPEKAMFEEFIAILLLTQEEIEATFYSHCVWLDEVVPPEEERLPKQKLTPTEVPQGTTSVAVMEVQPATGEEGSSSEGNSEVNSLNCRVFYGAQIHLL